MEPHPNEKLIRHAYELFDTGDIDLVHVALADAAIWHQPGRSGLAGDYKGPEEILGFLTKLRELSGGTFKADIVDVLAGTERVVVFQHETASRAGKQLDVIAAVDFEIHHSKVTEITVYQADTYQFDEFWS